MKVYCCLERGLLYVLLPICIGNKSHVGRPEHKRDDAFCGCQHQSAGEQYTQMIPLGPGAALSRGPTFIGIKDGRCMELMEHDDTASIRQSGTTETDRLLRKMLNKWIN